MDLVVNQILGSNVDVICDFDKRRIHRLNIVMFVYESENFENNVDIFRIIWKLYIKIHILSLFTKNLYNLWID